MKDFEKAIAAAVEHEPKFKQYDIEPTPEQKEILDRIWKNIMAVVFNGADDLLEAGLDLPLALNAAGVNLPLGAAARAAMFVCELEKRKPNRAMWCQTALKYLDDADMWCQTALKYLDDADKNMEENFRPHINRQDV